MVKQFGVVSLIAGALSVELTEQEEEQAMIVICHTGGGKGKTHNLP